MPVPQHNPTGAGPDQKGGALPCLAMKVEHPARIMADDV